MKGKVEHLDVLEAAIFITHKCKPTHKRTVAVIERTEDNEIVWEGNVEMFDLTGHKNAKTCYAWLNFQENGGLRIFTMLGSYLINSAQRAVQAAIFSDAQLPVLKPSKEAERVRAQFQASAKLLQEGQSRQKNCALPSEPPSKQVKKSAQSGQHSVVKTCDFDFMSRSDITRAEQRDGQEFLGNFVRLNLTGEVVELESCDASRVRIYYRGHRIEMRRDEVSRLTPEEAAYEESLKGQRTTVQRELASKNFGSTFEPFVD